MERDPLNIKLELLQDFYQQWEKFHQTANSNLPKAQKALAAQNMLDCADSLRAFYKPVKLVLAS